MHTCMQCSGVVVEVVVVVVVIVCVELDGGSCRSAYWVVMHVQSIIQFIIVLSLL